MSKHKYFWLEIQLAGDVWCEPHHQEPSNAQQHVQIFLTEIGKTSLSVFLVINTSVPPIFWSPGTHQLHSRRATRGRHRTTVGPTSVTKRSSASTILAACMRSATHTCNEGQTWLCLMASVSHPTWTHSLKCTMAVAQWCLCMRVSSVCIIRFDTGTLCILCL